MASNTEHLKLLIMDPVVDKDTTFNLKTMLNENWEKIDAAFPELLRLINGRAQIDFGSYVGTGTYGEESSNRLEFPFAVRIVAVIAMSSKTNSPDFLSIRWMVRPLEASSWQCPFNTDTTGAVSWGDDGKSVSWWVQPTGTNMSSGTSAQLNVAGKTYHYIAIGCGTSVSGSTPDFSYVLSDADKSDIASIVLAALPNAEGVAY